MVILFLPIPKCSFHMVCSPTVASPNSLFSSSNGTLSLNQHPILILLVPASTNQHQPQRLPSFSANFSA